jgi:hypothetical protein
MVNQKAQIKVKKKQQQKNDGPQQQNSRSMKETIKKYWKLGIFLLLLVIFIILVMTKTINFHMYPKKVETYDDCVPCPPPDEEDENNTHCLPCSLSGGNE